MLSFFKKTSSASKKLLLGIVFLNAAGLVLTSSSFAWFVAKKNQYADQNGAGAGLPELSLEFTLYKYDDDHNIISSKDPDDLTLNKYDGFIPEKNVYNPLIIKFNITGSLIKLANSTMYLDIECSEEDYTTQFISNVTEYAIEPLLITSTDNATIYNTALAALTNTSLFVNGTEKTKTIEKAIDLTTCGDLIHSDVLSVYIKVDYSEALINANFSDIEVSTETSDVQMHFENDIKKIYVRSANL